MNRAPARRRRTPSRDRLWPGPVGQALPGEAPAARGQTRPIGARVTRVRVAAVDARSSISESEARACAVTFPFRTRRRAASTVSTSSALPPAPRPARQPAQRGAFSAAAVARCSRPDTGPMLGIAARRVGNAPTVRASRRYPARDAPRHPTARARRPRMSEAPTPPRRAVFGRELVRIGPWTSPAALKRAHQRGVLLEHVHWDWLGGVRVYYIERILPGLAAPRQIEDDRGGPSNAAQATAQHLRRVLAEPPPRSAPPAVARSRSRRARAVDGADLAHR
jgi:hypothetical protein